MSDTKGPFEFLRRLLTWRRRRAENRRIAERAAWDDLLRREGFIE